jgi:3-isopropylmalate dehydrogenase
MLLRHTAKLEREAQHIEDAVESALRSGYRTADIAQPGCTLLSTTAMGDLLEGIVADKLHAQHAFHAV